jgi:hypothetical protein
MERAYNDGLIHQSQARAVPPAQAISGRNARPAGDGQLGRHRAFARQQRRKPRLSNAETLALLERTIKASSNEGDMVLDPFCGCGTYEGSIYQKSKSVWITRGEYMGKHLETKGSSEKHGPSALARGCAIPRKLTTGDVSNVRAQRSRPHVLAHNDTRTPVFSGSRPYQRRDALLLLPYRVTIDGNGC